ncbi:EscC/YscC/HrcC family type III secretion system outer membrane ring protein [Deltaproteobacteria bacterium Smac51]|nr:EscC/YscC/HrcC family type III secretion system outer membrane ring protein [Deltaproteobacteria bacterium Smac51]
MRAGRCAAKMAALTVGLLIIMALPAVAQAPLPPSGAAAVMTTPYTHFSDQEPVPQVLTDFARQQGLRATISGAVTGRMSGRFNEVEPHTFLEGLESAFGVRWYILANTIHFVHESEWESAWIRPQSIGADQLYSQLLSSALVSPQLPVSPPRGGMLAVEGPPQYIEQIKQAALALEENYNQYGRRVVMRVFRLKYASADDMVIDSMDRTVTVPGVASLLRAMVGGSSGGVGGAQVIPTATTVEKLSGQGLSAGAYGAESQPQAQEEVQANIVADTRVNAVIVHDYEYRMPYYVQVIRDLDREVNLVEIHAAIVDIDTDFKRELGVSYQGASNKKSGWGVGGELSEGPGEYAPYPEMGTMTSTGAMLSTIYTHGDSYFVARIQALEEKGEARMLGRPSVLTTDNLEATLENTTTYYIEVAGKDAVDLFKVESGTVLRVTPHIIEHKDGPPTIRMSVSVQDDQDNSQSTSGLVGNMAIPPIKQTKINTQALVEEGQSLLVGGYYFEEKNEGVSGIPVLMNIPVLGHLFKTSSKNTRKMERLVLITPRIIRPRQMNLMPSHIDDESFSRSPTQATYEPRVPAVKRGGCSRQ